MSDNDYVERIESELAGAKISIKWRNEKIVKLTNTIKAMRKALVLVSSATNDFTDPVVLKEVQAALELVVDES